ncbi:hypothetical protein GCM10022237_12250 [Nocardioides ginsengisoli]|uniref:DUF2029 domain-containing protein n=1 Tax=Nocardioides ginsengisoli TaxID=363868 RepID=A0ABW3W917_9ACTN
MPTLLRRAAVPLALGVLAAAYAWWRVPVAARDRLWAEDGRNFLSGSIAGVPVWKPYAGYLHVLPRLLTDAITTLVPVGSYAVAVTAASVGVLGLVCALTYVLTADLLDQRWVRVLVSLAPVLLPSGGVEVIGNLANLHGYCLWLAFWIVLHRPTTRRAAALWAVLGLLAALTEIVVLVLAPLLVVGWRDRLRWIPRAAILAGGIAQFVVSRLDPRRVHDPHWSPIDVVTGFVGQACSAVWTDTGQLASRLYETAGPFGLILLLVPPLLAITLLLWRGDRRHRTLAVALPVTAVLVWSVSIIVNQHAWMDFASWNGELWEHSLVRYATTGGVYLLALLLCALDLARGRLQQVVAGGVVVVVLGTALASAHAVVLPRERGLPWPSQQGLVARCAKVPDGTLRIPIAPHAPPWWTTVPCSLVG